MQGRTVGSSRNVSPAARFGAGPAVRNDALTVTPKVGRQHGSRPALTRSLLSMSLLAGGLSAVLIGSGVELGKIGLEQAVPSAQAATELVMPRPRVQTSAVPILAPPPAVLTASAAFAPVHDLDTELGSNAVDRVSYDFLLSESAVGDPNDVLEFGPMKIRRHLVQTIVKAAQAVQTDPVLLMAVADKESSFITAVQAKTSSATGLYQFIERTWLGVVRDFGAKYGLAQEAGLVVNDANDKPSVTDQAERARILELRRDPYLSALMAGEMLKRDAGPHRPADRPRALPRRGLPRPLPRARRCRGLPRQGRGQAQGRRRAAAARPGPGQPLHLLRRRPRRAARPPASRWPRSTRSSRR